jgi:pSer/pThr/pTyr-binding forkhead associated (FHA) protein
MPLTLRVLTGAASGTSHELTGPGAVLVGRSSRCGLMLPSGEAGDLRVSHTHALVEFNPPACRVHDLGSRNGTRVNGVAVTVGELKGGDVLTVGGTRIQIEVPADPDLTRDQPPEEDVFAVPTVHPDKPAHKPAATVRRNLCAACRQTPPAGGVLCDGCERAVTQHEQPIPGYRLVKEIGRGGMGVVFLAVRESDGTRAAIKTILTSTSVHPSQLAKFLRETAILRQLRHPHVVRYRDGGVTHAGAFLALDYVHGLDLHKVLRRWGPMTVPNAVRAVRHALSALAHAHARGFVHRDLKPSNLMLEVRSKRQGVKVTDFGLARAYHASQLSGLTLAGEVGGTPAFLPPEQILDFRGAEPAADQYSMGATLYNLLSGKYPFDVSGDVPTVIARILDEDPVPLLDRRADLPRSLAQVVHRAMSHSPADRFRSVAEFRAALEPFAGT